MAYVDIPKDLTSVKTKVMFNLTKRQLICFGGGALIGVPLFFVLKSCLPISAAALIMIIAMLPFFLLAMYEKRGLAEKQDNGRWRLTAKGFMVSNSILVQMLEAQQNSKPLAKVLR